MEHYYDNNAPVYRVTDHDLHSESDDTMFSDTSSSRSMSTLQSSQVAEYFRTVHGFTYVNNEDFPIVWPTNNISLQVDITYHTLLRLAYGGVNVPSAIDELLRSGGVDGGTGGASVLDVPTNSGVWVQEMAATYSTARFVSLDFKPLTAFEPHPRIEFEVYNLSTGILHPDASFDLVHARQCVTLTKDFDFLLQELHRVLKPGGILMITDVPVQPYEVDDPSVQLHSAPRQVAIVTLFHESWLSQGIDIAPWEDMPARLDPSHPLWANHLGDTLKQGENVVPSGGVRGFHSIDSQTRLFPSGPWAADEAQRIIGELARVISTHSWRALLPLLLMKGMNSVEAQEIVDRSIEELMDDRFKYYMKCKIWTARRI